MVNVAERNAGARGGTCARLSPKDCPNRSYNVLLVHGMRYILVWDRWTDSGIN